jgi:hypothetical protein
MYSWDTDNQNLKEEHCELINGAMVGAIKLE